MSKRLHIPDQWSNFLPEGLQKFVQLKQNFPEKDRTIGTECNISDFLKSKIAELHGEIEYCENIRKHALIFFSNGQLIDTFDSAKKTLDDGETAVTHELIIVLRQQKILLEDMGEELLLSGSKEKAPIKQIGSVYSETMQQRLLCAAIARKEENSNKYSFRQAVEARYDSVTRSDNSPRCLCPILGWCKSECVEATHIVPKCLDSNELSYLFGAAGEDLLSNPRNGLMLHKVVKHALHSGQIALVPVQIQVKSPIEWKVSIINTKLHDEVVDAEAAGNTKWADLHGKKLEFRNSKRPSIRFLFFRFVLTYLWSNDDEEGKLAWQRCLDQASDTWYVSGKHVRRSMLLSLCNMAAHTVLPQKYYDSCTFDNDETTAIKVSADAEEAYLCELVLRLKKAKDSLVHAQPRGAVTSGNTNEHANGAINKNGNGLVNKEADELVKNDVLKVNG